MRRCALVIDAPDVLTESVVACITLLILVLRYVMIAVVCKRSMFCLMRASVTFLCVLVCVMLNAVCLFCLCVLCLMRE